MALALTLPAALPAFADDTLDTLRVFADCAGRYRAMTEHMWLVGDPGSGVSADRRDQFADLVAAVMPDAGATPAIVRGWRIEAWAAQAALLQAATFRQDARAGAVARTLVARCDRLLPGA